MSGPIHCEDLRRVLTEPGPAVADVLVGEIDGLRTRLHALPAGATADLPNLVETGRVCLFIDGSGDAEDGAHHRIDEIALLAPRHGHPLRLAAGGEPLRFLELLLDLRPADRREIDAAPLPFFQSYSSCSTYRERIKSPKTVSRTLLPQHTWPRLCVGSVQTTGDDRVAAHEHPMLEQLFLGLAGNDCVVRADESELAFGADVLLHVPLGSRHGVEVHAPKRLHYVWIDVFRDREGMAWITQEHIPDP